MESLDIDHDSRVSPGEWELFLCKLGCRDKVHAALAYCEERTKTGAYGPSGAAPAAGSVTPTALAVPPPP